MASARDGRSAETVHPPFLAVPTFRRRTLSSDVRPPSCAPSFAQREIVELAHALGAIVDSKFAADKPFDYCIAKTTNSRKYELARALSKPVVTSAWLRDSATAGELLPLDDPATARGYCPPAFMGLCVCVTGYSQDERADIEAKVVGRGGAYTSDLVKGRCTHLVASNTTSSKYKHASKWEGVSIVNRKWIEESVARDMRADESRFPVGAHEAYAAEAEEKAERAQDCNVPWDSCFMLGTRVHLFELPSETGEAARATRIVRSVGATTTSNPSKATHVIVSDDAQPGSLRSLREHRERVVFMSWLDECARSGTVVDVDEHVAPMYLYTGEAKAAPPRPLGSEPKLSQEAASQDPRGEKRGSKQGKGTSCLKSSAGLPVTVAAAEPQRQRSSLPAVPNPLTRQALAKEAEEEAAAEAAAVARSALEKDQNRPPNADTGFSMEPGAGTGTELPATAIAIPETNRDVANTTGGRGEIFGGAAPFDGVYIALSDLLSVEEETAAREFITSAGGISVRETAAAAAYVVCPAAPTPEERRKLSGVSEAESARRVTCHWLEMCAQQGRVVPFAGESGRENPAYRPLPCDSPLSSMQNLRISTSLYDEDVKASVHMICHLLGAKYTDRLGRSKNTHLIVSRAEGAKFRAASEWGLHTVTIEWLHACVSAGQKVDESSFAPPASPAEVVEDREAPSLLPEENAQIMPTGARSTGDAKVAEDDHERRRFAVTDGSQKPQSSQQRRGALHLVGNASARASLSGVLTVSQPMPLPAAASQPSAPLPLVAPNVKKSATRRPPPPHEPEPERPVIGSDETMKAMDDETPAEFPIVARSVAAPAVPTVIDSTARLRMPPAQDGSQLMANMIDDMAAGMMSPGGEASLDGVPDDVLDGFHVPDPVQLAATAAAGGAHDVASPSRVGRGGGDVSGRKRRRGTDRRTASVVGAEGGGDGGLMSQVDVESEQMVGYADERPSRDGLPRNGWARGGGGGGAGLVNTLFGAAGELARPGLGVVGGKAAGLQAEDWM